MARGKSREDATLADILVDGFERNEILDGFHWRDLPMPDEEAAHRKFTSLRDEARRWKGAAKCEQDENGRRVAAWADLEIRQAGRGIMVRVRAPWFDAWWHDKGTWEGDPMGPIFEWLEHDRSARSAPEGRGDPDRS